MQRANWMSLGSVGEETCRLRQTNRQTSGPTHHALRAQNAEEATNVQKTISLAHLRRLKLKDKETHR